nr:oligosaccharide flippase family protein [uncultured Mucilaginibacter sp.]
MSKKNSLTSLTIIYTLGTFSSKVLQFVLVFVMTYFLTKTQIGSYDLILTTLYLIVPCVTLQVDSSVLRWLLDADGPENKDRIIRNAFFLLGCNIIVYSVIYWAGYFIYRFNYAGYIYALSLCQILLPTMQQGARGLGKNVMFTVSGLLYSFLYVIFTLIVLYFFKAGVYGLLIANALGILIVLLYLFFANQYYRYIFIKAPIDKVLMKKMVTYSLPLLPNSLSWWLVISATRYIILYFMGAAANGIFAISFKYPTILLVLGSIFNLAWQEKAIRTIDDENKSKYYSEIIDKYVRFLFGVVIILSCCSKFLMKNMVKATFFDAWRYMPILLLAVTAQALVAFYGAGYISSKETKGAFTSSVIGGVVSVVVSLCTIQFAGLYGVSASILVGFVVMLVIRINQTKRYFQIDLPYQLIAELTVLFCIISANNYIENKYIFSVALAASIGIFIFYNKNFINITKSKLLSYGKR